MAELMPIWMGACSVCVQLRAELDEAAHEEEELGVATLQAFQTMRAHLVDEHVAQLPGYDEACGSCREWKAMVGVQPEGFPMRVVPVLGQEDLLHRAGHLLYA